MSKEIDNMSLDDLRKKVNECNESIMKILKKRFGITREIGLLKMKENLPACDPAREKEIFKRILNTAKDYELNEEMVKEIFQIIMSQVVKEHKTVKKEKTTKTVKNEKKDNKKNK